MQRRRGSSVLEVVSGREKERQTQVIIFQVVGYFIGHGWRPQQEDKNTHKERIKFVISPSIICKIFFVL